MQAIEIGKSLNFFGKLVLLVLAGLGLCQAAAAAGPGPVQQGTAIRGTPASAPGLDLKSIEDQIDALSIRLLSLRPEPSQEIFKSPATGHDRVEIHLRLAETQVAPQKIEMRWDRQPVAAVSYSAQRQRALLQGGTEKLAVIHAPAGPHTLWIGYTPENRQKNASPHEIVIPVQKTNAAQALLIHVRGPEQDLTLEPQGWDRTARKAQGLWLDLWLGNAVFYYHLGDYPKAATLLLGCLEVAAPPRKTFEVELWLGKTYLAWGLPHPAVLTFRKLAALPPPTPSDGAQVRYDLQRAYYANAEYEALTSAYTQSGPTFPPSMHAETHYLAGQSYLYRHMYEPALAAFGLVPKASSFYPDALYGSGLAFLGLGDTFAAHRILQRLIDFTPRTGDGAARNFARLVEKGRLTLGLLLAEQNRFGEAISMLSRVPTTSPYFDQALFGIGWSYLKSEEHVKAIVAFEDLLAMAAQSPYTYEARLLAAYSYSKLKAYHQAVTTYRTALEHSSDRVARLTRQMEQIRDGRLDPGPPDLFDHPEIRQAWNKYQALERLTPLKEPTTGRGDLSAEVNRLKDRFAVAFSQQVMDSLLHQRQRYEDFSIQASIGIAKNLVLEKAEFGGEELTFD